MVVAFAKLWLLLGEDGGGDAYGEAVGCTECAPHTERSGHDGLEWWNRWAKTIRLWGEGLTAVKVEFAMFIEVNLD